MIALTQDSSPADVIRAGVEYIDEHGWRQGGMTEPRGSACMLAGIATACDIADVRVRLASLATLVRHIDAEHGMRVADFNDAEGREWDECRKEMLAAADAWDRGEL